MLQTVLQCLRSENISRVCVLRRDTVILNPDTRKWLERRAIQGAPFEVCGFIMQDGSIIEIPNSAHDPHRMFLMAREHLVDVNPELVQAIWHTHPVGPLTPSKSDVDAMRCGAIQPHWNYYIVTPDGISEWNPKDYAPQDDSFWEAFCVS